MLTEKQQQRLLQHLREYKRKYLKSKYEDLDEAATRIMINSFLTEVLGYEELEEVKTEYSIRGTYADYVLQIEGKNHLIVEVKAIQIDLSERHLRQALSYAANEGIDWILLTNGRQFELYRVTFGKPICCKLTFSSNLLDGEQLKKSVEFFGFVSHNSMRKGDLDKYWARFQAMEPENLAKHLYSKEVLRILRRALKKDAKMLFPEEDIFDSLHRLITTKIESVKPNFKRIRKPPVKKVPVTLVKKTTGDNTSTLKQLFEH